jgi:hypothetical protein
MSDFGHDPLPPSGRLTSPGLAHRSTANEAPVAITLRADGYVGVARLVVAGVATRVGLLFSAVDDLQQAVETTLAAILESAPEATVLIEVADAMRIAVAPAAPDLLATRLRVDGQEALALGAVLQRLVDGVSFRPEPEPAIVLRLDLPRGDGRPEW